VDDFDKDEDYKAFYDEIRAGKMPTTSQINIAEHEEFFESLLNKYDCDVVHLTLSSGLSNTYESACKAAENLNEKYGKRVYVVDSLGATVVQRIVVDEAERLRDADVPAEEAVKQLADFCSRVRVWFMPTDLMHLKRGGRVSGASAVIGTALNIKPILIINKTGGLSVVQKKIGVGKGMNYMAEMFKKYSAECTSQAKVYLPSADSEYGEQMKQKILEIRSDCDVQIGWVGPVIGAHTGAGMIGVCFLSDSVRDV
ncbi:MAG: DegV family protein, partial [Clostridiales bacterium]|nr:DegV family protein [Clostridiales bacterium]